MNELEKIVQKIEAARKEGLSDEKIKGLLDLTAEPKEIIEKFKEEKDLRTVEETAELLKSGIDKKETFNYHKVLRLVKEEKLQPFGDKTSNKKGYRFHITEIQRFIDEANMTSDDWKNRVSELQKQLEKALQDNEKLKKQNTTLRTKNKKLEEKQKESEK